MFTLGESQSERHILAKEKSSEAKKKKSKNEESEFFQQDKHLRIFLQCKRWTTPSNPHDKLI